VKHTSQTGRNTPLPTSRGSGWLVFVAWIFARNTWPPAST
jgi:hypothetical protein